MNRVPMTVIGQKKLQKKLFYLKNVLRPKIIRDLSNARKKGDLKENSEYQSAREQQSFCEGKIQDIEKKLALAQIIDIKKVTFDGHVIFGSTVKIEEKNVKKQYIYRIVGDDEANLKKNLISVYSPVARSLIRKKQGDTVSVFSPKGVVKYKIIQISYV